ncbi:MAG: flippase [Nanoarchaeota archaeon]
MSYTRKAVFGVGTILFIHLIAALLGYAFRFTLAQKLGVEQYGLFFSVLAFFFLFSTIKDLGIGSALVITLPKLWLKNKWDQVKSYLAMAYLFKLVTAFLLAILFWALAPFLSEYLFKTTDAIFLLRVMAVVFFLGVNEEILSSTFLGFQKYSYFACVELFKKILLLFFLFIFLRYGLAAPLFAYLLTAILLPFALLPFLHKTFSFAHQTATYSLPQLKTLLFLGLPFVFNTLTYSIISYFDTLLLTSLRTLREVGLYNAALPTAMAVLYFMYAFDSVLQPLSAELYHSKKKEKLAQGLHILHKYLFICILPLVILLITHAERILQVFYGATFLPAAQALRILMIGVLFYAIALMNLSVLSGIGQPKTVAKIMFWAALVNVILNLIFIPFLGIAGAALTTTISYALALILSCLKLKHYVTLQLPWKNWAKTLLGGLVLALLLYGSHMLPIWMDVFLILVSLISYLLLLFLLRVLDWKEVCMLTKELTQKHK